MNETLFSVFLKNLMVKWEKRKTISLFWKEKLPKHYSNKIEKVFQKKNCMLSKSIKNK